MVGAKIENGVCTNAAVFASEDSISQFGYIPCPDGFGIGDLYDSAAGWSKAPIPEAPTPARTISDVIADIKSTEAAQQRSQAAILAAQLAGDTPAAEDVNYFLQYEAAKSELREELATINEAESEDAVK